jgi:MFS family permease
MFRRDHRLGRRFGVFEERDFRWFFFGQATSWIGTGMLPVALSFAIINRGGDATQVGFVLGAQTAPFVVFLLVGGVVADRLSRRLIMVSCDLVRAAAQLSLGIGLLTMHPSIVVFLILEAIVGSATAFFAPSVTGLMPQLASAEHLQQGNGLNAVTMWSGNLFGPALSGVIVLSFGAGWAILADGATYLISAICLSRLHVGRIRSDTGSGFFTQLVHGWNDFRSRTWLWVVVVQFSFLHLLVVGPFLVLGAIEAHLHYGGAGAWSVVLVAQGAGSLAGALLTFRLRPKRPLVVSELACLGWAMPLAAFALGAPLGIVGAGAFFAGAGFGILGPLWDTTLQSEIPKELLSRVSAYDIFGSFALLPVGAILAGPMSSILGVRSTLLIGAGFVLVSCISTACVPGVAGLRGAGYKLEAEALDAIAP